MTITALLDSCVLYPAPLRDLLLHLAVARVFRARWSAQIHAEWTSALAQDRPELGDGRLDRTRALMDQAVPDALVTGHLALVPTLSLPDPADRHVLAAAIAGGAAVLVTRNLRDFPVAALRPRGLEPVTPDRFIFRLLATRQDDTLAAIRAHRAALIRPARTADDYIAALSRQDLPLTVAALIMRHRTAI